MGNKHLYYSIGSLFENLDFNIPTIENTAQRISNLLIHDGFIVHRYNSNSTNTVYLNIDCYLCGIIRISDHPEKSHKKIAYHLLEYQKDIKVFKDSNGFIQRIYPLNEYETLFNYIQESRKRKFKKYGVSNYNFLLEYRKETIQHKNKHWDFFLVNFADKIQFQ